MPANAPLVSVVVPTYNREDHIADALRSVVRQTYRNLEIIVVDDGSTDGTRQVVEQFAPAVRYVWQPNAERGAARNHGLRLATGRYIAFLDSDDLWLPNKVERGVEVLERQPQAGLVCTDAIQIDSAGNGVKILRAKGRSGRVTSRLLEENFVLMPTHLARTDSIRAVGGFREERELSGSEDWELWVRLSLIADFIYVREVSAKYRVHTANSMSSAAGMQRSMERAAQLFAGSEELAPYRSSLGRMRANVALVNAINHCTQGLKLQTMSLLGQAFLTRPSVALDPRFAYTCLRLLGTPR